MGAATISAHSVSSASSTAPAPALPTAEEIKRLLPLLTAEERAELDRLLDDGQVWHPLPGPQTLAYYCEADELYYGGAAGGGKSDLLIGLAATRHQRSIIFRRESEQLQDLIERSREVIGAHGAFNANTRTWRLRRHVGGRAAQIFFGGVQHVTDVAKFQGRPHDLKAFDELPNFLESQYRFLIGWTRTTIPGLRCRKVGAGNPPTNADGEWVIRRWGAWLDRQHPHPARPGELRWYAMVDGEEIECADGAPFAHDAETIQPQSRTFIPAKLADNPLLLATGYGATLQALPEPLRSQMLMGDFWAGQEDDPWQTIPTAWVVAAQARWVADGGTGPLTSVGVDVARGGKDQTVLARRYGAWFAPLEKHAGKSTPDGQSVAALVKLALLEGGYATVDGIGVGASVYDQLHQQEARVSSFIGSASADGRKDRTNTLRFTNRRSWAYWALREALDPVRGDGIALPPDRELLADLTAPRWMMRVNGVQVESKDDLMARLGRSPDCGDAVVYAACPPSVLDRHWDALDASVGDCPRCGRHSFVRLPGGSKRCGNCGHHHAE